MAGTIAVLFFLARVIVTIHIKVFLFLIKHFDITNGLIVCLSVHVFTQDIRINIWVRIAVLISIMVGCILLQHFFIPARIVFGTGSSIFGGMIAYGIAEECGNSFPVIPMIITIVIVALLNLIRWVGKTDKDSIQNNQ